ncbi:FtsX-like permease family protein [Candidatus Bathyarchaeota archaeon]|jgi:predicted lysophospholipase L1 biosynthesis ABC-type transport system permease subunit|nr:FtsX-like permease family protein [Candidatus Bathyarchaeota archaeon]
MNGVFIKFIQHLLVFKVAKFFTSAQSQEIRVKKEVKLPLSEALKVSLEQIRRRIKRSGIIIASIALGIALMSHFLVANLIFQSYGQATGTVMEAYQFWLIVVSFIVCVVGLTNSSLIAVYERYREIGIMKSLGALDRHVLELFMIEATLFGLAGGAIGFFLGTLSAAISTGFQIGFGALLTMNLSSFFLNFGYAVGLAVALNILSTAYPAYKAARLKPVEALEYEI